MKRFSFNNEIPEIICCQNCHEDFFAEGASEIEIRLQLCCDCLDEGVCYE